MPKSVTDTAKEILKVIPDGEEMKESVQKFIDSIFLELPENNGPMWVELRATIYCHLPGSPEQLTDWQKEIGKIWADAVA